MSGVRLFCFIFIFVDISKCNGITNYEDEKNLIGEEDRRGVIVKEERRLNDQKNSETMKRGLWLIGQHHQPSEYDSTGSGVGYHGSSGIGGYGYVDSDTYGISNSGYGYGQSDGGGYYKGPTFGHGYGYSGGGPNFGHGGISFGHGGMGFGHSGYGDAGHEMSQGHGGYNKLALKKLLIPLAGLAILGAAAAFSSNPVLLQLGTVQNGRRKRSVIETNKNNVYPLNPWTKPDR